MHEEGFSFLTSGERGGGRGRSSLPPFVTGGSRRDGREGVSNSFTRVINNPGETGTKIILRPFNSVAPPLKQPPNRESDESVRIVS